MHITETEEVDTKMKQIWYIPVISGWRVAYLPAAYKTTDKYIVIHCGSNQHSTRPELKKNLSVVKIPRIYNKTGNINV